MTVIAPKFKFTLSTEFASEDWYPLFVVFYKAFGNTPPIASMFPGGLDPAYRNEYGSKMKETSVGDGTVERKLAKIIEERTGDIVSYIACTVYDKPLGIADGIDGKPIPPSKFPGITDPKEREFWEWWWSNIRTSLRTDVKEIQVPNVYIQTLCTHPTWQNHGAATKLMEWIIDFAAGIGIGRCSLMASTAALKAGFYEKLGFRIVYSKRIVDEERFPGREEEPLTVLIRDP